MKQFTFYLDDETKLATLVTLKEQNLHTEKGAMAALIRTLLRQYATGKIHISPSDIAKEYTYTTTKNKRSRL